MLGISSWSNGRKNCVIDYFLFWARLDKVPAQMIVIEKLKVLNNVTIKMNNKPFIIPFVPCQLPWTNEYMSNKYICKEALGTLFGLRPHALKTLVRHAKYHTLPIHGLTGVITPMSVKFQENVINITILASVGTMKRFQASTRFESRRRTCSTERIEFGPVF